MGEATRMPVCNSEPQKDLGTEAPVISKGRSQGGGSKNHEKDSETSREPPSTSHC